MSYPTNEELLRRSTDEDNFIERKLEGASSEDLRKTIVAFANSVPEGMLRILNLGRDAWINWRQEQQEAQEVVSETS